MYVNNLPKKYDKLRKYNGFVMCTWSMRVRSAFIFRIFVRNIVYIICTNVGSARWSLSDKFWNTIVKPFRSLHRGLRTLAVDAPEVNVIFGQRELFFFRKRFRHVLAFCRTRGYFRYLSNPISFNITKAVLSLKQTTKTLVPACVLNDGTLSTGVRTSDISYLDFAVPSITAYVTWLKNISKCTR